MSAQNTILNHTDIQPHHAAAMERMILQHRSTLDLHVARDLYLAALAMALQQPRPAETPQTIVTSSRSESGSYVGVATDMLTGIYAQLSASPEHPASTLLTFGQKWSIEIQDGIGHFQTKYL